MNRSGSFEGIAVVRQKWLTIEIEGVIPETVDVLCEIGTDGGNGVFGHGFASFFKCLDQSGQRVQVMKYQIIGYQMIVLDSLALLVAAVSRDDTLAAEEGPFDEPIQCFAFINGFLDG